MCDSSYQLTALKDAADSFFILSGCSGGGKSTLVSALGGRGYLIFPEPGRQVVREQLFLGGDALPEENPLRFAELCVSRAISQRVEAARTGRLAVFDRGIIDVIGYLDYRGLPIPAWLHTAAIKVPHNRTVFFVPPWRALFTNDAERRHGFEAAEAEYGYVVAAYERYGHQPWILPKTGVEQRLDVLIGAIKASAEECCAMGAGGSAPCNESGLEI